MQKNSKSKELRLPNITKKILSTNYCMQLSEKIAIH